MFSKATFVSVLVLALGLQAHAHNAFVPMLGVSGTPARSDVQRPSAAKPCGNAALSAVSTSTAATIAADGTMTITSTDFNAGADGSRAIKSISLDTTATGKSFKALPASAIVKNGDANPTTVGSQTLTVQVPAGTKCTGGSGKNLCLMSITSTAGFGNCVVGKQAAAKRDYHPHGSREVRAAARSAAVMEIEELE
ncbi:hypothetical protein BOTBODRAFT_59302 [Botryobasidium botryosum FD-172 SS1]|uniref:Uncharacterized protein n=1 Tax=Botryobasidium botryosum (strain FD-172 SS1) TaxID=930990 RepID=A0A067M9B0_BOTB1|nr:hypothetical protein BOTBODRAFT_59302 [Botryobasidium botryosum FD-172 SS1]